MPFTRSYTTTDTILNGLEQGLRTLFAKPTLTTHRPNPAADIPEAELSAQTQRHVAGLMRVNHCGEVCAQALYQGQALTARDKTTKAKLERAAEEENDHLAWCEQRLTELNDRKSYLNPVWYSGSLTMGVIAGMFGDKWNLGFLAETERQVVKHLQGHLDKLPVQDNKTRAILAQMCEDEDCHAATAVTAGAQELPQPIKQLMAMTAKIMTKTAYWV